MRKVILGLALGFGGLVALGCGGMAESIMELADVKVEAQSGDDAVHPADFPLPPPEVGTIVNSMTMDMAGMKTVTVQYQLPDGSDHKAIIDGYEPVLAEMGTVARGDSDASVQLESGGMVTAQIQENVLSLVVVETPE